MKKIPRKEIALRLALAGLGTGVTVGFIALSYYVRFMSLAWTVLTATGIMVPLSKDFYREGILTALAAGAIGFFIANVRIVPYAMASGLYVVLTVFLYNKKVNVLLTTIAKVGYSCLVFWVCYTVVGAIGVDVEQITALQNVNEAGLYAILNVVFSVAFVVYDLLVVQGYAYAKKLAAKVIRT